MLKLTQTQKQSVKLSPQQIQSIKMLAIPTIALEERIKEEMEINPALEEGAEENDEEINDEDQTLEEEENKDDDEFELSDYMDDDEGISYKEKANNKSSDEEQRDIPFSVGVGFHELLESQLGLKNLNGNQYQIALFMLGNIDDDGYLRRDLESIVDDLAFTQNIQSTVKELEEILEVIQDLDPAGVGARNLQECLLLQLRRKEVQTLTVELAIDVVEKEMENFSKKHYDKIAEHLDIDDQELFKEVIHEIIKLNPRPGNSMNDGQKNEQQIIPDFTITNEEGELVLTLNSRNSPDLRVSPAYKQMMEDYKKEKNKKDKEASTFVKQKLDDAQWFIDAIKMRGQTMLYTMTAIMHYQREYLLSGDEAKLKPMILHDVAEKTGLDPSSISRITSSKYVQTPFGTISLKSFFSDSMTNDSGEEISSREIKKALQDCVAAEDKSKPLTDAEIIVKLKEKGYVLARRTVAKYREDIGIPVARLRKEL
jgi:RNA polymerase sigma-54 factor